MPKTPGEYFNRNTVWIFDVEAVRKGTNSERELRGVNLSDIERETGVNATQLSTFLNSKTGLGLHGLVSLAKWANIDLRTLAVRQRNAAKHSPSSQEQQLRILKAYMNAAGLQPQDGESVVDAAVRVLALAKANGVLQIADSE